jgi:uroporphyrinogen-III synthase
MPALQGVGVLVTRPEQQAVPLCRLLAAEGATGYRFPAIDIVPLPQRHESLKRLPPVEQFDVIIFVSTNAVRFGAALLEQRRDLTIAAVGPATARALNQAGYRVDIMPAGAFDSEGLLAHPRLQYLAGRRVLLIKGTGGRELLAGQLSERGAIVDSADVYERRPAVASESALAELELQLRGGIVQVITATSLEIGSHVLAMATPRLKLEFDRVHWLVPGERVADGLRGRGLHAPLLQAGSAEDQDLLAALIRWRSTLSGA